MDKSFVNSPCWSILGNHHIFSLFYAYQNLSRGWETICVAPNMVDTLSSILLPPFAAGSALHAMRSSRQTHETMHYTTCLTILQQL